MKYTALRPILRTHQFDETLAFYTGVLGFSIGGKSDEWASLHRDGIEIMISTPNDHTPFDKPSFTGSLYINTDDADGLWARLKDQAEICYEPEDFSWGMREFAIYDNNGYTLQFGQPVSG